MHKMVVMYPRPQDETKFRNHYEANHIPLAKRLPGFIGMRHSVSVQGVGEPGPYFCIFEADFPDERAFFAAMTGPEGEAVKADLANFVTTPPLVVHYEVAD